MHNLENESSDPEIETLLKQQLGQSAEVEDATIRKWQDAVVLAAVTRRRRRMRLWAMAAMIPVAIALAVAVLTNNPSTPKIVAGSGVDNSGHVIPPEASLVAISETPFPQTIVWHSATSVEISVPGWQRRRLVAVGPGSMRAEIQVRRVLAHDLHSIDNQNTNTQGKN